MSLKPFKFYTWGTPNGFKVSVFLEELKLAYPEISYEYVPVLIQHAPCSHNVTARRTEHVNISTNIQKEPWFIKLNPNGRIPVLVDTNRGDFTVFETAAILIYLQTHYDTQNKFGFDVKNEPNNYSEQLQWIFFAVSDQKWS